MISEKGVLAQMGGSAVQVDQRASSPIRRLLLEVNYVPERSLGIAEIGPIVLGSRIKILHPALLHLELFHMLDGSKPFGQPDLSREQRIAACFNFIGWKVLRHQADCNLRGEFLLDPSQRLVDTGNIIGQDEKPYYQSAFYQTIGSCPQLISHLPVHFSDCRPSVLNVSRHLGIQQTGFVLAIFQVRKVDIDYAVQKPEHFQRVVCVRVVHDRQSQSALSPSQQSFDQLGHKMGWRHPVDVVAAAFLKLQENLGQTVDRDLILALLPEGLADLMILAVYATQVAQTEENVPGPMLADQARLLTK